jgi:hypothetical protein
MNYCLYNAIKTPDGHILHCKNGHDYQTYKDTVSGEEYMLDGVGYTTRRSINKVPAEDLSVWTEDDFELVRKAKFWTSYGKDGQSAGQIMALCEMEDEHVAAILRTQKQLPSELRAIFEKELPYREAKKVEEMKHRFGATKAKKKSL